jgi:hypothetical protein
VPGRSTRGGEHILDDRIVAGLKGSDKIILLIRIQALIRGALARRKVKSRYGYTCKTMGSHNKFGSSVEPNYSNPRV